MDYLLVAVGLLGFVLAGQKKWYAWYVNIACQFLWLAYAIISQQYGFILGAIVYTIVFTRNAVKWTKDHFAEKAPKPEFATVNVLSTDIPEGLCGVGGCVYLKDHPAGMGHSWERNKSSGRL